MKPLDIFQIQIPANSYYEVYVVKYYSALPVKMFAHVYNGSSYSGR